MASEESQMVKRMVRAKNKVFEIARKKNTPRLRPKSRKTHENPSEQYHVIWSYPVQVHTLLSDRNWDIIHESEEKFRFWVKKFEKNVFKSVSSYRTDWRKNVQAPCCSSRTKNFFLWTVRKIEETHDIWQETKLKMYRSQFVLDQKQRTQRAWCI